MTCYDVRFPGKLENLVLRACGDGHPKQVQVGLKSGERRTEIVHHHMSQRLACDLELLELSELAGYLVVQPLRGDRVAHSEKEIPRIDRFGDEVVGTCTDPC